MAADRTGISGRLPYVWKNRKDRTGRWFRLALARAEHAGVQRLRGEGVNRALKRSDAMLLAILRARDPWFIPKEKVAAPKTAIQVNQQTNNYADAQYSAGTLTDEELATMDRLLLKMGVPQELLEEAQAPPIDVDAAAEAQPSRDHDSDSRR